MAPPLRSHFGNRIVAAVAGFIGGGVVFGIFIFGNKSVNPTLMLLAFPLCLLGGMYLSQLLFSLVVPAICPSCGAGSARPGLTSVVMYECSACGAWANCVDA